MGFATLENYHASFLLFAFFEQSIFFTGAAGASGDGSLRLADGTMLVDGIWRVMPAGWGGGNQRRMRFCRGENDTTCVPVEFDEGPGVSGMGLLSILDPHNRGGLAFAGDSLNGGSVILTDAETRATPLLGIWVTPIIGTIFHCGLEASGPRCHPAMVQSETLAHGTTLAVQSIRGADGTRDVLWESSGGRVVRCEVAPSDPRPACAIAMQD
jgi:hypothetical protein